MEKLNLFSKVFLDGGDAAETKEMKDLLGFVDGQTTNPSLITQNPQVKERIERGEKFSREEAYLFYKDVVSEIAKVTSGPISVEVYADKETKAEDMLKEAREMMQWIPNAYIKLPIIKEGLKAANLAVAEDIPVNMTLCFTQEQAAAVHAATKGSKKPVFVSPFVGRLDDRGEDGMSLIENILKMYKTGDGHVLTLAASVRNLDHFLSAISVACPLITVPFKVVKEWAEKDFVLLARKAQNNLTPIIYQDIPLDKDWQDYNISHELTDSGIERFCNDWKAIIK